MPEEIKTVEDAVTSALAELALPAETVVEDPPESEEVVETPEVAGDAPAIEETDEQKTEREAAEAAALETEETDEEKTAREAAEAEAAANASKTPEQIAAEKEAAKKPKTLEDHLNDPISPQLKTETRERMQFLANTVRDLQPRAQQGDELFKTIADTGMTGENFAQTLNYARAIRSPKLEDQEQAWDFLLAELKALAPRVGRTLPGMNPLEGHPDLQALVKEGKTTPELAAEAATARNRTAAATKLQGQHREVRETQAQFAAARSTALTNLNTLGKTLLQKEGKATYEAKYAVVVPILKKVFAKLHPADWEEAFQDAWANVTVAAPAAKTVVAAKPGSQPLRANKQPSGGGQKQPTTMQEAIQASLAAGK